jgi:hypothetical protein
MLRIGISVKDEIESEFVHQLIMPYLSIVRTVFKGITSAGVRPYF